MSEQQYYTVHDEECGAIHLSVQALRELVRSLCLSADGIAAMATAPQPAEGGVALSEENGACAIAVYVLLEQDVVLSEVADELQTMLHEQVPTMSGMAVSSVDVFVAGICLR